MVGHTWETVDARVWDPAYSRWLSLSPWESLELEARGGLTVGTGRVTLHGDHPAGKWLRGVADGRVCPVTVDVNGVRWSGQVQEATRKGGEGEDTWEVTLAGDQKHFHRMLARPPALSADDGGEHEVRYAPWGALLQLVGPAAQRTGLPVYLDTIASMAPEGDVLVTTVRTESTVADVVGDFFAGASGYLTVAVTLPGDTLPPRAHYRCAGIVEREWERAQIEAGAWPNIGEPSAFVQDIFLPTTGVRPAGGWVANQGLQAGKPAKVDIPVPAWKPFSTVQAPMDYWGEPKETPVGTFIATETDLERASRLGTWVTEWSPGTFRAETAPALALAVGNGEVCAVGGETLSDAQALYRELASRRVFAWARPDGRWCVATEAEFTQFEARFKPNMSQYQTPGIRLAYEPVRDRRQVVFSSIPGGGLSRWEVAFKAPEAAGVIAGGQVDQMTLQAAQAGVSTPRVMHGPGGGEVVFTRKAGDRDLAVSGPMFWREKYVSLSGVPEGPAGVDEVKRLWEEEQGGATAALTPAFTAGYVFGDDVEQGDRTLIGWKPGDRVSFVDGETRLSEIVDGYRLVSRTGQGLEVTPLLGRRDVGVMARLAGRVRGVEKTANRALAAPAPRVSKADVQAVTTDVLGPVVEETRARLERVNEAYQVTAEQVADLHTALQVTKEDLGKQALTLRGEITDAAQGAKDSLLLALSPGASDPQEARDSVLKALTDGMTAQASLNENQARWNEGTDKALAAQDTLNRYQAEWNQASVDAQKALSDQVGIVKQIQAEEKARVLSIEEVDRRQDAQLTMLDQVQRSWSSIVRDMKAEQARVSNWEPIVPGSDWAFDRGTLTARGNWAGDALIFWSSQQYNVDVGNIPITNFAQERITASNRKFSLSYNDKYIGLYRKRSGSSTTRTYRIPANSTAPNARWTTGATHTVTSEDTHAVDVTVRLAHAHRGATYGVRIKRGYTVEAVYESSTIGPIGPAGDGNREMRVQAMFAARPGETITAEYYADYAGTGYVQQREFKAGEMTVTFVA